MRFNPSTEDRLRHVLVVGKTGSGKSTLLRELCRSDLEAGHGLLLVDPHGDLATQVLADAPRRRKNDLLVVNGDSPNTCPGLNPLRAVPAEARTLAVSGLVATIRKLFPPEFWGPRMEHVLRNVLMALTETRGATLLDATRMLVDERHRKRVLAQVTNPQILEFWLREFAGYPKPFAAEVIAPILNKLGALLASTVVRTIVSRRRPRLDPRRALDRSRVVVASLPKGKIGEDTANFLGGLLLGAFQQATLGRAELPRAERRPFFIYVDEVGSFATKPFVEMVAEARKFGVGLVMAGQSLAAMDRHVRAALLGNVGTLVTFRVGADDSEILSREFASEYPAEELMRLEIGECVVRTGARRPVLLSAEATRSPDATARAP